jgi:hypothetical protein
LTNLTPFSVIVPFTAFSFSGTGDLVLLGAIRNFAVGLFGGVSDLVPGNDVTVPFVGKLGGNSTSS